MRHIGRDLPKALLPVGGKPFLAWQLEWLASEGIGSVVLCVGYKADRIREYVGDGSRWNIEVRCIDEGRVLLGTGGALRNALDVGSLDSIVYVLYGDSLLQVSFERVFAKFMNAGLPVLMTVFENHDRLERSNAVVSDGRVVHYTKHDPSRRGFEFIDYGLSVWTREAIGETIPRGERGDLGAAFSVLAARNELGALVVKDRFYEVGSPDGMRDLEEHLGHRSTT